MRVNGLGLAAADALANADTLADRLRFLEETRLAYVRCRQLVEETGSGGKQIQDANIAATGLTYGIDAVVTFNTSDFEGFPELRVLSPEYEPRET
ncbi:PIN domain-containing protein [Piscicoccus intestinalis]|uniref:PIN domain-containing protein n=1 Tax=Piscicoccus intestinalis TaxID=746033 RepID=UPI000837FE7F|nr:PIN domain-containing protein [Piscicoccus intestinalis]